MVSLTHDAKTFMFIEEVVVEPCETLAIPEGHQLHATLADYEAAAPHWKEVWAESSKSFEAGGDIQDAMRSTEAKMCARYAEAGTRPRSE